MELHKKQTISIHAPREGGDTEQCSWWLEDKQK